MGSYSNNKFRLSVCLWYEKDTSGYPCPSTIILKSVSPIVEREREKGPICMKFVRDNTKEYSHEQEEGTFVGFDSLLPGPSGGSHIMSGIANHGLYGRWDSPTTLINTTPTNQPVEDPILDGSSSSSCCCGNQSCHY